MLPCSPHQFAARRDAQPDRATTSRSPSCRPSMSGCSSAFGAAAPRSTSRAGSAAPSRHASRPRDALVPGADLGGAVGVGHNRSEPASAASTPHARPRAIPHRGGELEAAVERCDHMVDLARPIRSAVGPAFHAASPKPACRSRRTCCCAKRSSVTPPDCASHATAVAPMRATTVQLAVAAAGAMTSRRRRSRPSSCGPRARGGRKGRRPGTAADRAAAEPGTAAEPAAQAHGTSARSTRAAPARGRRAQRGGRTKPPTRGFLLTLIAA